MISITWEPLPPSFLKVYFDSSIANGGRRGGAGFVIQGLDCRFVAESGSYIYDISVL